MSPYARKLLVGVALLAALFSGQVLQAQGGDTRMMKIEGQGVFNMAELGAVIVENDSTLSFVAVMPVDQRPEAYKDVDVKANDVLVMCNGARMHTADQLTTIYDKLKPGEEIKFAVRRGKDMRLVTMAKADPAKMPKMMTMTRTIDGPGEGMPPDGRMEMLEAGPNEDIMILGKLGVVATVDHDGIKVAKVLPDAGRIYADETPEEGDLIVALGTKAVNTPLQLDDALATLSAGDKDALSIKRGDKKLTLKFTVPETANPNGTWQQN